MPRPLLGRAATAYAALLTLVTLLAGVTVGALAPASAASAAGAATTPGAFTGYAFDARCAPTQAQMDAWWTSSPFTGVGIYLGGSEVSCGPEGQPHLDATWVQRQSVRGWRLLPIWVGPQASCSTYDTVIDATPDSSYAAADAQGRAEATLAARRAGQLGVAAGSTLWYDLEGGFDLSDDDCRRSALRFLSGWTLGLRSLGYRSGVYSNIDDGIHALDYADTVSTGSYTMPDQVWFAWANGRADTTFKAGKVRETSWVGQRVHQYVLDLPRTYGGVTLTIDVNYMHVGGGSVAPPAARVCGGARVDRPDYPRLTTRSRGDVVRVAQCLLRAQRVYRGPLDGRFDRDVVAAVRTHQRRRGLPVGGAVDRRTWTTLLAAGTRPLLKVGAVGGDVRRLQRALNVATDADLRVTGVLDPATSGWVARYQARVRVPASGVMSGPTWAALAAGRV